MDPSFFGLEGHPFDSTSDVDESYIAETHASLIAELRAGLKAPHGITLLIGEEGTGKTTLIRRFGEACGESCTVAYLPTTGPGLRHLLTETIEQLGGTPPPAGDEQALLESLSALARARAEHGRTTLVLVDDAHELPAKTIERVGRLFGDDPAEPTMLHVVLVGRSELLDRMNAANDRTILKHLVQVCRMDPIGPEESFRYIADRIAKVGGVVDKLFTEDALRLIVKKANGNPGRIDAICSAALKQAAESGKQAVGADTVDLACTGVEGFSIDTGNGKPAEKDPMQYIFGDDEVDDGESRITRRLREGVNGHGSKEQPASLPPSKAPAPPAAPTSLAEAASAVRERFVGMGDNRRRLSLWAIGLVAVLVAFSATLTRTGDRPAPKSIDPAKVAAAPAGSEESERAALPASAVRTSKLVIKRDGEASQGEDSTQAAGSELASASDAPTANDEASRPHVQAPPYQPPTTPPAAQPPPPQPQAPQAPPPTPIAQAAPQPQVAQPVVAAPQPPTPVAAQAPQAPAAAPAPPPVQAQSPAIAASSPPATPGAAPQAAGQAKPAQAPTEQKTAAKSRETKPVVVGAATPPKAPAAQATLASAHNASAGVQPGAGKYTVQLGAFKSRENAETLLAKVQRSYPDGRVVVTQTGGAAVYRVISGAFASKHDADSRARTLAANGYTAFIRDLPK